MKLVRGLFWMKEQRPSVLKGTHPTDAPDDASLPQRSPRAVAGTTAPPEFTKEFQNLVTNSFMPLYKSVIYLL
jgi:hypothetical protein